MHLVHFLPVFIYLFIYFAQGREMGQDQAAYTILYVAFSF